MRRLSFLAIAVMFLFNQCKTDTGTTDVGVNGYKPVEPLDWTRTAAIYEVNVRQYSVEGNFEAVYNDLERIKSLGVDILWFMPIHPIGEKNRKGEMGSYYSVKDYKAINPEFGTMEDFKKLVNKIHDMDMKIIIDWVPNHSSWDNPLTEEHPDYYLKDSTGNFVSPYDWTDVIQFDYANPDLRQHMIDLMKFWLIEANIDGFRCDVAHMVPVDFWNEARKQLDEVKDIFFLAESDQPFLHDHAFEMTYAWELHHIMNEVAKGHQDANDLHRWFQKADTIYPPDAYLMTFTSNHDENSWAGTVFERMGEAAEAFLVFSATIPGMPLVYNGQEAGMNKRLAFFTKDTIPWKEHHFFGMYQTLFELKEKNKALRNGMQGGDLERIETPYGEEVFAFVREKEGDKIVAVFNFSDEEINTSLQHVHVQDENFILLFKNENVSTGNVLDVKLEPWGYKVFVK